MKLGEDVNYSPEDFEPIQMRPIPQEKIDAFRSGLSRSRSAKYSQIGGGHYHNRAIQPFEYALANNFNYLESNVLKYLTRHREKNGAEDLRKAIHALELLIEVQYGREPENSP